VHSALQKYLDQCCSKKGINSFQLRNANPYAVAYKAHCSKKVDRQFSAAAAAEDSGRSAALHTSLGKDAFLRGCESLLSSPKHGDALTLSMMTAQVQMVARGDDLRGRSLPDLSMRTLDCIGGCQ
jgi:hypothetical protein